MPSPSLWLSLLPLSFWLSFQKGICVSHLPLPVLRRHPERRFCRRGREGSLYLVFALALALLAPPTHAQDLRYLHHQSWSTEDGLPQNSVHQILQTPDGFLWLSTEAGIARFDGVTFKTFSHTNEPAFVSDDACCLATTPNGDLWIGTPDGLVRYRNQHFHRFDKKDGLPPPRSAPCNLRATTPSSSKPITAPSSGLRTTSSPHQTRLLAQRSRPPTAAYGPTPTPKSPSTPTPPPGNGQ